MPTLNIHIEIAKRCSKILEVNDNNDYLLGMLFPDIHMSYNEERRDKLHYYIPYEDNGIWYQPSPIPNVMKFIYDNAHTLHRDFYKGYLIHLIADAIFNEFDNTRIGCKAMYMTEEELNALTSMKRRDFILCGTNYVQSRPISFEDGSPYAHSIIAMETKMDTDEILSRIAEMNVYITDVGPRQDTELYKYEDYELMFSRCMQMAKYYYNIIKDL